MELAGARVTEKTTFLDGCHKYGWLITLIGQALLFAYFVGGIRSDVSTMADRLSRVERVMDNQAQASALAAAAAAAKK